LGENGLIVISTPNAHSLEVQLLRDGSTTIDVEHISVLTPAAVHSLAIRHGFEVQQILTPGSFDLELIQAAGIEVDVTDGSDTEIEMQELISNFGFSSHMKIIMSKGKVRPI
jgi:hypothetical protein